MKRSGKELKYQFDLNPLLKRLEELKVKRVGLVLPEGLKIYADYISSELKKHGYEVIVSGNFNYGACDVPSFEFEEECDCLVNFGHASLPIESSIPMIFIEVDFVFPYMELLKDNIDSIKKEGKKVGLVSTVNYVRELPKVKEYLESEGFEVVIGKGDIRVKYPGQILGCDFSSASKVSDKVDFFIFVGEGRFHPLGVAISTEKKVFAFDCDGIYSLNDYRDKILKERFGAIFRAKDSKKFGLIVSSKKGQKRMALAKILKRKIEDSGFIADIILMDEVSPDKIYGFDYDSYVICACPRIGIDDAKRYKKPLLTPKELEIVLDGKEDYFMDEIDQNDF
ncbi:MAG: 2-(3-amino-3-carboxypropyl)histidine synthase [Candidatus Methanofastidiosum methylothiophilum]|uniref:2-(3-amino-3-carboxypropyl)histidine synthase n=1 Tax=Candidatus Methanofastidiosum methylothiophilum TaxID=1705564 RepID=A0A150IMA1_9EURY|nr:MAG: 2-(3-amino-3-carboxypropyl)histidine synthase [Candidatus Methanofastidiosum methylthiophilus]KYC48784.1 MAG: 2-(3-amino-3-carboxypropyl)histidine synthase [Candidatus Methanofastidiosum methylthiophilus]KYC51432.1 MAG: 2-(3-amino-3-carboxypropyl)histidine synthase [Candidatus Methanofastidiosum methylthiophilus]